MFTKFIIAQLLNGLGDVVKRFSRTVKTDHVQEEVGHWVKGRFGVDPHIVHPSSVSRMLFGDRAHMDKVCTEIDKAIASAFSHGIDKVSDVIPGLLEKVVEEAMKSRTKALSA